MERRTDAEPVLCGLLLQPQWRPDLLSLLRLLEVRATPDQGKILQGGESALPRPRPLPKRLAPKDITTWTKHSRTSKY